MNNYKLIGTVVELINEEDKIAIKLEAIGQSSNGKNRALLEVFTSEGTLNALEKAGVVPGSVIGVYGYFKSYIDLEGKLNPCLEADMLFLDELERESIEIDELFNEVSDKLQSVIDMINSKVVHMGTLFMATKILEEIQDLFVGLREDSEDIA